MLIESSIHFLQQVINCSDPVICKLIIFGCVNVSLIGITAFRYSFLRCCMVSRIMSCYLPVTNRIITTNACQAWMDSRHSYSEYMIINFDYLIIPFDYLIIG